MKFLVTTVTPTCLMLAVILCIIAVAIIVIAWMNNKEARRAWYLALAAVCFSLIGNFLNYHLTVFRDYTIVKPDRIAQPLKDGWKINGNRFCENATTNPYGCKVEMEKIHYHWL